MSKKILIAILFLMMAIPIMPIMTVSAAGNEENSAPFSAKFIFGPGPGQAGYMKITNEMFYSETSGYGFATEVEGRSNEFLTLAELGSGFTLEKGLDGQQITNILMEDRSGTDNLRKGACYSDKSNVPLTFVVKVPHNGNYNVKVTIGGQAEDTKVSLFAQNRRSELHEVSIKSGEYVNAAFTVNVGDIFVRDRSKMYPRDTIAITLLGKKASISSLTIEEAPQTPTVYILGDSTLTDQAATYPYSPAASYCGWAQQLPQFFKDGLAIANHAHSGWTTADPINRGEWDFIQNNIKPNDYFFIQFGHNDQKNPNLTAEGGFTDNLKMYVEAVKAKGAIPIIVTPLTRINEWANNNQINNTLAKYTAAAKAVAEEEGVALIDLTAKSMDFMGEMGQQKAPLFYAPKDKTHNNTYGAYEMAKLICQGIQESNPGKLAGYLRSIPSSSLQSSVPVVQEVTAPISIRRLPVPLAQDAVPVFNDIKNSGAKQDIETLAKFGIVDGKDHQFFPEQPITRRDFFVMVLKTIGIGPVNVYNDMYTDVMGNEWYGGLVEAAYENNLIDAAMTPNKKFSPDKPVTREEMAAIIMNAYKNVKTSSVASGSVDGFTDKAAISPWAVDYVRTASQLGLVQGVTDHEFAPQSIVTRGQAAISINRLLSQLK